MKEIDKIIEVLVRDMDVFMHIGNKGVRFNIDGVQHLALRDALRGGIGIYCRGKLENFMWDREKGRWKHIPAPQVD